MSVPPLGVVLIVPVVSVIDVMSVFAPEAAAPRLVNAAPADVAPVPPFAMATVPVTFEAVPVVFWLSVGTSAATIARNVGTPAEPFGAARTVLAVCDAKSDGVTTNVPPSVSDPAVVTVPLRLKPLTVPVPETDDTVPVPQNPKTPLNTRNSTEIKKSLLSRIQLTFGKNIIKGLVMRLRGVFF